jgi:hypothetical protein
LGAAVARDLEEGVSEEREQITAWLTRYALTQGILKVSGEVCHNISSGMLSYGGGGYAHGNDWHRSVEAATARAEKMRADKLASLRKQIAAMERLQIKVKDL